MEIPITYEKLLSVIGGEIGTTIDGLHQQQL